MKVVCTGWKTWTRFRAGNRLDLAIGFYHLLPFVYVWRALVRHYLTTCQVSIYMKQIIVILIVAVSAWSGVARANVFTSAENGFAGWTLLSGGGDSDVSYFLEDSTTNGDGDGNADGDINSASGQAWGLSARDDAPFPGSVILLGYDLSGGLNVGQTLSIDMDTGFIDAGERYVGFELDADGFDRFQFRFQGGDSFYEYGTISDGYVSTGIPYTDEGLTISLTLTGINTYDMSVTRLSDGTQFDFLNETLGGPADTTINRVEIFNREAGEGLSNNSYFNNLSVVPEPASVMLMALGIGSLLVRRKRLR